MVNIFSSAIRIEIYLHRTGYVELYSDGRPLYTGSRESCMAHIRKTMAEFDRLGNKDVTFAIKNYTSDPMQAGMDRAYFKRHLLALASGSSCTIHVNTGLDTQA